MVRKVEALADKYKDAEKFKQYKSRTANKTNKMTKDSVVINLIDKTSKAYSSLVKDSKMAEELLELYNYIGKDKWRKVIGNNEITINNDYGGIEFWLSDDDFVTYALEWRSWYLSDADTDDFRKLEYVLDEMDYDVAVMKGYENDDGHSIVWNDVDDIKEILNAISKAHSMLISTYNRMEKFVDTDEDAETMETYVNKLAKKYGFKIDDKGLYKLVNNDVSNNVSRYLYIMTMTKFENIYNATSYCVNSCTIDSDGDMLWWDDYSGYDDFVCSEEFVDIEDALKYANKVLINYKRTGELSSLD